MQGNFPCVPKLFRAAGPGEVARQPSLPQDEISQTSEASHAKGLKLVLQSS